MTDTVQKTAPVVVNRGTPPATTDFNALKVVHTRHYVRWVFGALVLFVVLQFLWSLATNDRYGWDVVAEYFFDRPSSAASA